MWACRKLCKYCIVRSLLPVCCGFSLTRSLLPCTPPFLTTCGVSDRVLFPVVGQQHLVLPLTQIISLLCYTYDRQESQCCSLAQGKLQTQEKVFKYLCIQRFVSCIVKSFTQISNRAAFQQYVFRYRCLGANSGVFSRFACTSAWTLDVSIVQMTAAQAPRIHLLL